MAETIAVVGAGVMGSGIAQSAAMAGKNVRLYDISEAALENGLASIQQSLSRFVKAGKLSEQDAQKILQRIRTGIDLQEAVQEADVVIEAVPEDLPLKKGVFQKLDRYAKREAILATNTSELSVTAIARATTRPDKVIGMHWFNPAPVMKLIEIVKGVTTSEETVAAIQQLSKEIGKETVVVKDRQGFVTTRAIAAHMIECIRMYEEGVASAEDIDKAVRLGLNYPMGPLELADMVGLDTMLFVSENLTEAYGDRFRAPQILRKLVEAGHFGRKTERILYVQQMMQGGKAMREVVIAEAVRTPVGKRNGVFRNVHPVHLAAIVLDEVVKRAGIEKRLVEDIVMGCVTPIAEQGYNIGRLAALEAGFPIEVPAVQINRMCGSGQQAIHFAAQEIRSGDMDITIAAGVESMTKVPILSDGNEKTIPPSLHEKYEFVHQGISAELIAEKYGLTREQLDAYAYESHQRAIKAQEQGIFDQEIVPVEGLDKEGTPIMVTKDEGPRRDTSPEALASLRPVFQENGKITAGNASQMSDGAAAVLLMEKETARKLGATPKAKIIAQAVVGSDPTYMLDGVIPATKKVLQKAGLTVDDIDLIEINEAFAPVVLAWQKEIGAPFSKVNVNGGAIALGHPLGATGAKLMTSLVYELIRRNGKYGLLTICIGHGMATATIIERL